MKKEMTQEERNLSFQKLYEEKIRADDGPYEFDGWNCHDLGEPPYSECDGWDGQSHRCNCGNRRVTWLLSDDGTYIYAEAY